MALGLPHRAVSLQARNITLTGIRCLQNIQRVAYHSEVGAALDGETETGRCGEHALSVGLALHKRYVSQYYASFWKQDFVSFFLLRLQLFHFSTAF